MNRRTIIIIAASAVLLLGFLLFRGGDSSDIQQIKVPVKKGPFEVIVTTTGELQAKNSEDIKGPDGLRRVGIWNVKITDLIPEGTVVKEGEYIGSLDRTEIGTKLQDLEAELQKIESQYLQTKLDTSLDLREIRDNLINLKYAMEEAQIALDQSKFEPPETIRQAEITIAKAERAHEQAKENYVLKVKQAKAKMQEVEATLYQQQAKYDDMVSLLGQFKITAPKDGMLIYIKEWNGKKKTVGSTISTWNPSVATLPDLSLMTSETYVNEVDIRKIKLDQEVEVGVDAFPGKKFSGNVIEVANIGEQRPNSDAKVFQVKIEIKETDTLLRPSMTTSNAIKTAALDDVIYVPLECLHANDSVTYVIKSEGFRMVRKEVKTGLTNENEVVIEQGLKEGDIVFLSTPDKIDNLKFSPLKASN